MSVPAHPLVRLGSLAARHPALTVLAWTVIAAAAVGGILRIQPSGSLDVMLAQDAPAARAMSRVVEGFGLSSELILLVSAPPEATRHAAREQLLAFAQRFSDLFHASAELSALCTDVTYGERPELRQFIREQVVPSALLYVDDATLDQLLARLTTEEIRAQIRRNEELASTPGAAGQTLTRTILRDPLRLHETLIGALARGLPRGGLLEGEHLLLSQDGRTLMIRLAGARPASDLDFARRFVAEMTDVAGRANHDRLRIEYTGAYAIAVTAERSIRADMVGSVTGSVVLLLLLFLLVYRDPRVFLVAGAPVAVGIAVGFGLGGVLFPKLTPVAAVSAAVLAGLAIDYSIHFLSHVARDRAARSSPTAAVQDALLHVGPALTTACATSVIGFVAIAQSSVPALRQFAAIGALGLGAALVASVTLLPAMLCLRGGAAAAMEPRVFAVRVVAALLSGVCRRPRRWVAGMAGVALAGVAVVASSPQEPVPLEHDLTVMHPRPNPPLELQHAIADRFGVDPDTFLLHLHAADPERLLTLAHRVQSALQQPGPSQVGVVGSFGPASLLPDPAIAESRRARLAAVDLERIIEDLQAALADSIFDPAAYEAYDGFLRQLFHSNASPGWDALLAVPALARMFLPADVVAGRQPPTEAMVVVFLDRPLADRAARNAAIAEIRAALSGTDGVTLTGVSVIGHDTERLIWRDLARLLLAAAGVIAVWLAVYFRSPARLLLAVLPALFGLLCVAAVMHLADVRLNMVNLIGLPILIGIGVDHGIFLVSLAAAAAAEDHAASAAPPAFLPTALHAILMTTLTTLLTFGTLVFTSTPAIRSLGVVLGVGMVGCLAGTTLLLVPILALGTNARDLRAAR